MEAKLEGEIDELAARMVRARENIRRLRARRLFLLNQLQRAGALAAQAPRGESQGEPRKRARPKVQSGDSGRVPHSGEKAARRPRAAPAPIPAQPPFTDPAQAAASLLSPHLHGGDGRLPDDVDVPEFV